MAGGRTRKRQKESQQAGGAAYLAEAGNAEAGNTRPGPSSSEARPGRTRRPRRRWIFAAAVVVLVGGFLVARAAFSPGEGSSRPGRATPGNLAGEDTVMAEVQSLVDRVPASGEIEPREEIAVRPGPNVPSRAVSEILVSEGEEVTEGQVLARLNSRGLELELESAEAEYDAARHALEEMRAGPEERDVADAESAMLEAEAQLDSARQAYEREQRLYEQDLVSERELEVAEHDYRVAELRYESAVLAYEATVDGATANEIRSQEAQVARAQNQRDNARLALEETNVRAPEAGRVAEILVNRGDIAGQDRELMTLIVDHEMVLRAGVDETDIADVALGQRATVEPWGLPDAEVSGTVTHIDQRASQQGNATVFFVDIVLPNPDGLLRWGMEADAEIVADEIEDALVVPQSALERSGRESVVFVRTAEGEAEPRTVETGLTDGTLVQIVEGLSEGEQIVADPHEVPDVDFGDFGPGGGPPGGGF